MEKDKADGKKGSSEDRYPSSASLLTGWLLPVLIICLSAFFAWTGTRNKAPVFDELIHVTSGVAYWTLQDYRVQPENGNLPQRIAGLPHYLFGTYPEIDTKSEFWADSLKWRIANNGWYFSDGDPEKIKILSRAAMLSVNLLGLFLVFRLSLSIWGLPGAYLSLFLAAFSPNFLGHMPLATSDFMGAWTLVLAVAAYARLCQRVNLTNALLCGLAIGIALLSKHSAVAFVFVAAGMFLFATLIKKPSKNPREGSGVDPAMLKLLGASGLAALVALTAIWAFHSWRFSAHNPEAGVFEALFMPFDTMNADSPVVQHVTQALHRLHILPEAFIYGLSYVLENDSRTNFLNGEFRQGEGFPLYFVFCFLYKTPLPALLLHVTGIASTIFFLTRQGRQVSILLFGLVLTALVYGGMLVNSDMNIGYRHAFPVLLISCILCGSLLRQQIKMPKLFQSAVLILALSLIPLAWASRGHYISYINPLGGGVENGYRVLRESSLDWGQDLPSAIEIIKQARESDPEKKIYFSYFGSAEPEAYGVGQREFLPGYGNHDRSTFVPRLEAGLYIISATSMISGFNGWPKENEREYLIKSQYANTLYKQLNEHDALAPEEAHALLTKDETAFLNDYEYLRFSRLWKILQHYQPDQILHGSILVYDLDQEDLKAWRF